jgi:hypothetical protein
VDHLADIDPMRVRHHTVDGNRELERLMQELTARERDTSLKRRRMHRSIA